MNEIKQPLDLSGMPNVRELRRRRRLLDLSQERLAKAAGVSQTSVVRLEKGRVSPNSPVFVRIVLALMEAEAAK